MAATAGGPAALSRRRVMASGALAGISVLAGGCAGQSRAAADPPRLRMTTTSDLTTVLAWLRCRVSLRSRRNPVT